MSLSRRRFLLYSFGAGGLAAFGLKNLLDRAVVFAEEPDNKKTPAAENGFELATRTGKALGAEISMAVYHKTKAEAEKALDAAFAELETVEQVMSIYRPQSELSRLNRDGELKNPHKYLVEILEASNKLSARCNGAFDVTVQPLWTLYFDAQKKKALPSDAEIETTRKLVDYKKLEVARDRVRFTDKGMGATLNGIAQGYASDKVTAVLREAGVAHALVNTGEIRAIGKKPAGAAWTVGIQDPRRDDAYAALAKLDDLALSTSGDYNTFFSDDKVFNHIFDPATGKSPVLFSSVTVVAKTGTEADGLTKPLFIQGLDAGAKLIEATPGASAYFIDKEGKVAHATRGFPSA